MIIPTFVGLKKVKTLNPGAFSRAEQIRPLGYKPFASQFNSMRRRYLGEPFFSNYKSDPALKKREGYFYTTGINNPLRKSNISQITIVHLYFRKF
jgi:hypothetical protein